MKTTTDSTMKMYNPPHPGEILRELAPPAPRNHSTTVRTCGWCIAHLDPNDRRTLRHGPRFPDRSRFIEGDPLHPVLEQRSLSP